MEEEEEVAEAVTLAGDGTENKRSVYIVLTSVLVIENSLFSLINILLAFV